MFRRGSLELATNLFLSPLAGYTNLPFRLTLRELGGLGLATTDLVNARSLLERRPQALKLIESRPADQPLAVQLFGSVPEEMRDAAAYLESVGVAAVDINMGCPVRKVCRVGGGSAMMTGLAYGEPVKEIVHWVKPHHPDLVAMSTHGHQFMADLVLGTTAINVQHAVSVPVLLLRAK